MAKAAKLFAEALKDKAEGNIVSARMNMKLAISFDSSNNLYHESYQELLKAAPIGSANAAVSRARELYDKATTAEKLGRFDEAIELLEQAIEESKDPAFFNRLGVLLAMKKNEFDRAQSLIETALEMSPGNSTYEHNLSKVLQRAAAQSMKGQPKKEKKDGILGFLGRKK
jgi:tetratricopeptide (TPR) repeat protein